MHTTEKKNVDKNEKDLDLLQIEQHETSRDVSINDMYNPMRYTSGVKVYKLEQR